MTRVRRLVAATVALAALALPQSHAVAATDVPYVSGPGAFIQWTLPAFAIPQGATITYTNLDIQPHDFVAVDFGPDLNPWCVAFPTGGCPLFWSPLIGIGFSTPVSGVSAVPSGLYDFYCSRHRNMQGTLVVLPGA